MQGEKLRYISLLPCYWHLCGCTVMLTLVDKSLLVKFYHLSQESVPEDLRRFWTEKKMKKGPGPITPAGLNFLKRRFEETGCLQNQNHSGTPLLSEVRTSSVVSQMNTLRKQTTSRVPAQVYSKREFERNTGIRRYWCFTSFMVCCKCTPTNCNCFNSCR